MTTLMQDTAHEKRAMSSQVEAVGRELTRYGLVVVVGWIGLMKFTTYEAEGIRPFVANSPLMSWVYGLISVPGFSAMLGVVEVTIALLIAARPFSPLVSALGISDVGVNTPWDQAITPGARRTPWWYGSAAIPRTFADGTSNTIAFTTQYSRCGTCQGNCPNVWYSNADEGRSEGQCPFFAYYAPKLPASSDRGIDNGRNGEIFQVQPTEPNCNPSYTPQSYSPGALSVSMFDGSVRMVGAAISPRTWGLLVQPNDGEPSPADWE